MTQPSAKDRLIALREDDALIRMAEVGPYASHPNIVRVRDRLDWLERHEARVAEYERIAAENDDQTGCLSDITRELRHVLRVHRLFLFEPDKWTNIAEIDAMHVAGVRAVDRVRMLLSKLEAPIAFETPGFFRPTSWYSKHGLQGENRLKTDDIGRTIRRNPERFKTQDSPPDGRSRYMIELESMCHRWKTHADHWRAAAAKEQIR
jgi:hypothetical protein